MFESILRAMVAKTKIKHRIQLKIDKGLREHRRVGFKNTQIQDQLE
jgi:hypothetical protein